MLTDSRHEHLVRYLGWYSNRARGDRAKALKAHQPAKTPPAAEFHESAGVLASDF